MRTQIESVSGVSNLILAAQRDLNELTVHLARRDYPFPACSRVHCKSRGTAYARMYCFIRYIARDIATDIVRDLARIPNAGNANSESRRGETFRDCTHPRFSIPRAGDIAFQDREAEREREGELGTMGSFVRS